MRWSAWISCQPCKWLQTQQTDHPLPTANSYEPATSRCGLLQIHHCLSRACIAHPRSQLLDSQVYSQATRLCWSSSAVASGKPTSGRSGRAGKLAPIAPGVAVGSCNDGACGGADDCCATLVEGNAVGRLFKKGPSKMLMAGGFAAKELPMIGAAAKKAGAGAPFDVAASFCPAATAAAKLAS